MRSGNANSGQGQRIFKLIHVDLDIFFVSLPGSALAGHDFRMPGKSTARVHRLSQCRPKQMQCSVYQIISRIPICTSGLVGPEPKRPEDLARSLFWFPDDLFGRDMTPTPGKSEKQQRKQLLS